MSSRDYDWVEDGARGDAYMAGQRLNQRPLWHDPLAVAREAAQAAEQTDDEESRCDR